MKSPSINWFLNYYWSILLPVLYLYIIIAFRIEVFKSLCEIASCTIYSFIRMKQQVLQIDPYHWFVLIWHWNGFDHFLVSDCNGPDVMTVIGGDHSHDFFVAPFCDRNRSRMLCHDFAVFLVSCFSLFVAHSYGSTWESQHCLVCDFQYLG
jgi:hypothetical protein